MFLHKFCVPSKGNRVLEIIFVCSLHFWSKLSCKACGGTFVAMWTGLLIIGSSWASLLTVYWWIDPNFISDWDCTKSTLWVWVWLEPLQRKPTQSLLLSLHFCTHIELCTVHLVKKFQSETFLTLFNWGFSPRDCSRNAIWARFLVLSSFKITSIIWHKRRPRILLWTD